MTTLGLQGIRSLGGELQRLRLEPGDKLVIHSDERLTVAAREHVSKMLERIAGVPVIVLDKGYRLGVLSGANCWGGLDLPKSADDAQ